MSIAMKCDRCGQCVGIGNNSRKVRCEVKTMALFANIGEYDLCEECAKELKEFMREREENE